jgi:hypothetical protein
MFLIQRYLISSMFIPHEFFTPQSMYTLPRGGVQRGGTPSAGSGDLSPRLGGSGEKPPKEKLPCKCIL